MIGKWNPSHRSAYWLGTGIRSHDAHRDHDELVARAARLRELEQKLAEAECEIELLTQGAQSTEIERLREAIRDDLDDARSVCGGDGHGCEAYRDYDWPDERKHRKCGQCPMDALSTCREALEGNGDE